MKIRQGFVSNSSSSSFVIGVKNGELSKEFFTKGSEDSPFRSFIEDVAEYIINTANERTVEDIIDDYCDGDTIEELVENGNIPAKLIQEGYKVYTIYASYNESDDPIELMIGNGGLENISTEDFKFISEY